LFELALDAAAGVAKKFDPPIGLPDHTRLPDAECTGINGAHFLPMILNGARPAISKFESYQATLSIMYAQM
jgi:hypothetical protein